MLRWSWLTLMLSCQHPGTTGTSAVPTDMFDGSGDKPAGDGSAAPVAAIETTGLLAPEAACARFAVLESQGCAWSVRFPPEFKDTAVCARSLATWFAPETHGHDRLERTIACWAHDCDAAAACMIREQSGAPPPPPRTCGEEGTSAIYVDDATWNARRGADARHFDDVQTTVDKPVEVCGVDGEVDWLTRVTCANGSNPFGTPDRANAGRDSWMARGGHCNSILDRYSVTCPEATYVIYVDRYVCQLHP